MRTYSVNLPDDQADAIIAAVCGSFSYQEFDDTGKPNPETPEEFYERMLAQQTIEWASTHLGTAAANAAINQAKAALVATSPLTEAKRNVSPIEEVKP